MIKITSFKTYSPIWLFNVFKKDVILRATLPMNAVV